MQIVWNLSDSIHHIGHHWTFWNTFFLLKVVVEVVSVVGFKAWALEFSSFSLIPSSLSFFWIILKIKINNDNEKEHVDHVIYLIFHMIARDRFTLTRNQMNMINDLSLNDNKLPFLSLVAWILVDESWITARRLVGPDVVLYLPDLWETGCNVLAFCDCLDCVIILIDCPMALFAERGFLIDERSTCGRLFPSLIQLWHKTEQWIHFYYHDKLHKSYIFTMFGSGSFRGVKVEHLFQ